MNPSVVEIRPTRGEKVRACLPDGRELVHGDFASVVDYIRENFPEADVMDIRVPEFIPAE